MNNRPLTEEEVRELRALEKQSDNDIDTSDIAEITDEQWRLAKRGQLYRPIKQSVTIRLDADVLAWFKDHANGRGYQTEINSVLRRHIARHDKKAV